MVQPAVSVKISNAGGENQREAEFYIDGIFIGSYSNEKDLNENEQYSGLRGWHTESKYYSLEIELTINLEAMLLMLVLL